MGLFITFEGGEGCGKSTQARILWKRLCAQGLPAILLYEPGGTALGDRIKRLVKRRNIYPLSPQAELFLFVASRAQLVAEAILPALQEGKIVICDRFAYSTLVYQGYGRGLDLPATAAMNKLATQGLKPDLAILLDISPEQGLSRKQNSKDRFELEDLSFHQRVREGYLKTVDSEPDRWLLIDATLPRTTVSQIIWRKVGQLYQQASEPATGTHG